MAAKFFGWKVNGSDLLGSDNPSVANTSEAAPRQTPPLTGLGKFSPRPVEASARRKASAGEDF